MEEKKIIKLKFSTIIAIILVVLTITGLILFYIFSKKSEISLSDDEIKRIVNSSQYETEDEQLKEFYNELLDDGTLIVSKESASTVDEANNLSIEYKDKLNEGISNELNSSSYESYTNFEYIDFIETTYYYKYIGEYTYKYRIMSDLITDYSSKYTFLIFKSDYFEFPYLKEYRNSSKIKEFGDMLTIINFGNEKLIKSEVKDNGECFVYDVYYADKMAIGPDMLDVITEEKYFLNKASFTVDKSTGKTDLYINQSYYQGYMDYKNSYNPRMNIVNIKSFVEEL